EPSVPGHRRHTARWPPGGHWRAPAGSDPYRRRSTTHETYSYCPSENRIIVVEPHRVAGADVDHSRRSVCTGITPFLPVPPGMNWIMREASLRFFASLVSTPLARGVSTATETPRCRTLP